MCYLFLVVVAERSILFGTFSPTPTCLLASRVPVYTTTDYYFFLKQTTTEFADHVCWTSHHGDLPPGVSH
ncbi:hypothetical protein PAHAL_7G211100 [Panicum hallii]|uniref:Secreted protein n=1 Tax=Panicum hallii TaxID=206008 RepID=A0A2T8ID27_9POAL|nr:hypothetical protein PAHAL_7G211100 [Panicum hallii]